MVGFKGYNIVARAKRKISEELPENLSYLTSLLRPIREEAKPKTYHD